MGVGRIEIGACCEGEHLLLQVTDNAGLFQPKPNCSGLGMNLVDKRIRVRYGEGYGVQVDCRPDAIPALRSMFPWRGPPDVKRTDC